MHTTRESRATSSGSWCYSESVDGASGRATAHGRFDAMSEVSNESVAEIGARLDAVDAALDRIRDGSYRQCAMCAGAIETEVLAGDPLRTTCAAHPTLSD